VRRLVEVVVGDHPATWRAAGFTVDGDTIHLDGLRLRLVDPAHGRGIRALGFDPAWTDDLDGLCTIASAVDPDGAAARQEHRNGAVALDHLVVTSPDPERTTAALVRAGIEPRRSIVGARGDTDVLYRFFLVGTCVLELIGPAAPLEPGGPARFAGLAFTSVTIEDLDGLTSPPKDAIQPGRRIATLRPEVGASIPIAFLSPRP
jgi:hypothetical protein